MRSNYNNQNNENTFGTYDRAFGYDKDWKRQEVENAQNEKVLQYVKNRDKDSVEE